MAKYGRQDPKSGYMGIYIGQMCPPPPPICYPHVIQPISGSGTDLYPIGGSQRQNHGTPPLTLYLRGGVPDPAESVQNPDMTETCPDIGHDYAGFRPPSKYGF